MSSQLESEVQEIQSLQKDMKKLFEGKQRLIEQQQECELVKKVLQQYQGNGYFRNKCQGLQIDWKLDKMLIKEQSSFQEKCIIFQKRKKIDIVMKDNENKQITKKTKIMQIQQDIQKQEEVK